MIHSLPTVLFMQEEKTRNHAHFAENKKTKMCHFYVDILNRNLKINIRI
jgi:hypothetical protein